MVSSLSCEHQAPYRGLSLSGKARLAGTTGWPWDVAVNTAKGTVGKGDSRLDWNAADDTLHT